jgi:hypothetical protein
MRATANDATLPRREKLKLVEIAFWASAWAAREPPRDPAAWPEPLAKPLAKLGQTVHHPEKSAPVGRIAHMQCL